MRGRFCKANARQTLEKVYQERLEERIISYLAEKHKIDCLDAMDWYYNSELAVKIHNGENGIQYLDYTVLTDILDNELKEAQ